MLRELRIKDFTIIDDLSINFEPGLNILTGETGAGKSIIVDALGLLLGDRASQDMIKTGRKEAHIEAFFDNTHHPLLKDLSIHVSFIDTFGGLLSEVSSMQSLYNEALSLKNKMSGMKERIRERGQRIEFLRFQINEIDAAQLKKGEKASVEEERAILLNLSKLKESSETAYMLLYEAEGSSMEQLSAAASKIREMAQIDHSAQDLLSTIEAAVPLLEDAAILLRKFKDKYDIDPQRLNELDERLEMIKRLEKKYGEGVATILQYRERAVEELKNLEHMDEQLEAFEVELNAKEDRLLLSAEDLSAKRGSAAEKMEKMVIGELHELGFRKAVFTVEIKRKEAVTASGLDDIEFLFSANPGEQPKPLAKVASGGELSRIMLALKCIEISQRSEKKKAAAANGLRTLIFDEVDAGIGGVTAQHVGKRLKDISGNYQVLCITHLPQIAALADYHLKVEKILDDKKAQVIIVSLSDGERRNEIARMLSGRI
ncbi:MAG: DNA repair protein RecN, partial [Nitrospirae bacterium]|nr:DNA repair protein RecN [Nitrospirota bacterium]